MSKYEILIKMDKPDDRFRTEESITGSVEVNVKQDMNCLALKVGGYWTTHGRGNRDSSHYGHQVVYQGKLEAGKSQTYPFRIPVDRVPLTYHGQLINLDHYVDVRIDVPGINPKHRTGFILLPGSAGHPSEPLQSNSEHQNWFEQPGAMISLVFCLIGLVVTLASPWFGFIVLAIGLSFAFHTFSNFLAEQRLGKVQIVLESRIIAPGDSLPISLRFTPKTAGQINEVVGFLTGTEMADSSGGTDKTTHCHELYNWKFNLSGQKSFRAHREVVYRGHVQIPETDAYSFDAGNNSVSWTIELKIDIPSCPDWNQTVNLCVVPREFLHRDSKLSQKIPTATPSIEEKSEIRSLPGDGPFPSVGNISPAMVTEPDQTITTRNPSGVYRDDSKSFSLVKENPELVAHLDDVPKDIDDHHSSATDHLTPVPRNSATPVLATLVPELPVPAKENKEEPDLVTPVSEPSQADTDRPLNETSESAKDNIEEPDLATPVSKPSLADTDRSLSEISEPAKDNIEEPTDTIISLAKTCQLLHDASHDSEAQAHILKNVAHQNFTVAINIKRISPTYSWDQDSKYNNGKTLIGILQGTDYEIQVQIPHNRNDQVNQLRMGNIWTGTGQITGHDSLFRRIEVISD